MLLPNHLKGKIVRKGEAKENHIKFKHADWLPKGCEVSSSLLPMQLFCSNLEACLSLGRNNLKRGLEESIIYNYNITGICTTCICRH